MQSSRTFSGAPLMKALFELEQLTIEEDLMSAELKSNLLLSETVSGELMFSGNMYWITLSSDSFYSGSSKFHPVYLNISMSRGSPISLVSIKVIPVQLAIA
jgi:hypothetical protein